MEDMETEIESTESDATEGSSSEASESSSGSGASAQAAAPEQKTDTTPFHEHPRFKELVEQKNESLKRYQDIESRYKTLEQQFSSLREAQPKQATETDALLEDLKKVDPRLANALEKTLKAAEITESNRQQFEQYQKQTQEQARNQVISNAVTKINSLHESNKMSDFGKQFINNQLDLAYRSGNLNASDLKAVETAYTEASKVIKTYEDSLKRTITQSYVETKTKDSSVPTSVPKGAQAKAAPKAIPTFKNKDDLKSAVIKSYLKESAASKEASNT